jgi:hypothetical protein
MGALEHHQRANGCERPMRAAPRVIRQMARVHRTRWYYRKLIARAWIEDPKVTLMESDAVWVPLEWVTELKGG